MSTGRRELDKAVVDLLKANSNLTDLLKSGAASIFNGVAPSEEEPTPYVIFSRITPNRWAYTWTSRDPQVLYFVKAVTNELAFELASDIDDEIDTALQDTEGAAPSMDNGWTFLSIRREQDIDVPPIKTGGQPLIQVGGVYRLMAEQTI